MLLDILAVFATFALSSVGGLFFSKYYFRTSRMETVCFAWRCQRHPHNYAKPPANTNMRIVQSGHTFLLIREVSPVSCVATLITAMPGPTHGFSKHVSHTRTCHASAGRMIVLECAGCQVCRSRGSKALLCHLWRLLQHTADHHLRAAGLHDIQLPPSSVESTHRSPAVVHAVCRPKVLPIRLHMPLPHTRQPLERTQPCSRLRTTWLTIRSYPQHDNPVENPPP